MSKALDYQRQSSFPKEYTYFWRQQPYPQEIRTFDLPEIALPVAGFLSRLCASLYGFTATTVIHDGESGRVIYDKEHYAVPSSGGLHPCSLFLGLNTVGYQGVYYYHQRRHVLQRIQEGNFLAPLEEATFNRSLCRGRSIVLFLSIILPRTILKYGFRSYRYLNHDIGHILGNLRFSAGHLNFGYRILQQFDDRAVGDILGLDHGREEIFAVVPLEAPIPFEEPAQGAFHPVTNSDSYSDFAEIARNNFPNYPYPEITLIKNSVHQKALSAPFVGGKSVPQTAREGVVIENSVGVDFPNVLRKRKSATSFVVGEKISWEKLSIVLSVLKREPTDVGGGMIVPYLLIHNVEGLDRGLYICDIDTKTLHVIRRGDFRSEGRAFAYGQNLGGGGACCVIMVAPLAEAARQCGDRTIRSAYQESGVLGQQLYLACAQQGLGISGIGAYLDGDILYFLNCADGAAVLYLMGIGSPAPDDIRFRGREMLKDGRWVDEAEIIENGYAFYDAERKGSA